MRPRLVAVMGPTASGKSALAEGLADLWGAVLINADAFQAYRGLDIGTAKPDRRDRYQLLDVKDPTETYGAGEFVDRAYPILVEAFGQGRHVVVVGGTGLYLRALFEEYDTMAEAPDPVVRARLNHLHETAGLAPLVEELVARAPEVAAALDLRNPARVKRALERLDLPRTEGKRLPPFRKGKFVIVTEPAQLNEQIAYRAQKMVQNGWLEEVRRLKNAGLSVDAPGLRAIGYREWYRVLNGELSRDDAMANVVLETRRYAKRQRTWLRSEPNRIELRTLDTGARLTEVRTWIESEDNHYGQSH